MEYENVVYRSASRSGAMDEKAVSGEWKPAGAHGLNAARYGRPMTEGSARDFAGDHWPTVGGDPRHRFISTLPGAPTCRLCGAHIHPKQLVEHRLTAHGIAPPETRVMAPSNAAPNKKMEKGKLTKSQMKKKKKQEQWLREAHQITFVSGGLPALGKNSS